MFQKLLNTVWKDMQDNLQYKVDETWNCKPNSETALNFLLKWSLQSKLNTHLYFLS